MSNAIKKFEVGKTYYTRSICDHDCIISGKVISRTAATVKMDLGRGEGVKTLRIIKRFTEWRGAESVMPWGAFSMAPVLSADKDYLAA